MIKKTLQKTTRKIKKRRRRRNREEGGKQGKRIENINRKNWGGDGDEESEGRGKKRADWF